MAKNDPKRLEQGYILLWILFYFTLFFLIAISFLDTSTLESLISINHQRDTQAFAMADGGTLMGAELIYSMLNSEYSASQVIPAQLMLDQHEWTFNTSGRMISFYLDNPTLIAQGDGECCFQFISQGNCAPAQKKLIVVVRVKFTDYYQIQYGTDANAQLIFNHRQFNYPAQITSMKIIDD